MGFGQFIGLGIFWLAGMGATYLWLRDAGKSHAENLRELGWVTPVVGAMAGLLIFAIALATTGPDTLQYGDGGYFSRR